MADVGISEDGAPPASAERPRVSFREALRFWTKLGFISFGGPAGQIAIMHRELVDERRWISEGRFLHALNYCMLLPGPEAQQLATYIGWLLHRTWGGVAAGALFVIPSLAILIGLSWLYIAFGHVMLVAGAFHGIKPAVVAIVVQAVVRIGSRALRTPTLWAIAGAAFIAMVSGRVPFPAIVLGAALAGALTGRSQTGTGRPAHASAAVKARTAPAAIDDDTPVPPHAVFGWTKLLSVTTVGIALWAVPMGALVATFGGNHTLTEMAWFFSKAALLTFGGAYAVLPYVYQGAVEHFGWLTAPQMIDGLALGETTPGPLIMVVAFVGFVGGYQDGFFGPSAPFLAGATAAVVVTWFTFLPSFVFILAGGPLVERTHGEVRFTAPLTAITAAVVGVILSLALFLASHVFWPRGLGGPFDWPSALLAIGAVLALMRYRLHVIPVIGACALVGLLLCALGAGLP